MSLLAHDALSEKVLRVNAAVPISDALADIRRLRVSHVAVFNQEQCLGCPGSTIPIRHWAIQRLRNGNTSIYECENRLRMKSGESRWNLDRGAWRQTVG